MEKPAFTRAYLSGVRVIVVIMHFPLVERMCQTGTGGVPVLECLLFGVCRCLWSYPIKPSINDAVSQGPCPSSPPDIESPSAAAGDLGLF
jgi:hypothetical protein